MLALQARPLIRTPTREIITEASSPHNVQSASLTSARYELFRRALVERDDEAWETLYKQYECLIASWIAHRLKVPLDVYPYLINEIWIKLLTSIRTPEKFSQFPSLGSLLAYLKCCTLTVCVDYIRSAAKPQICLSLDELQEEESPATNGGMQQEEEELHFCELLSKLAPLIRTERERVIAQVLLIEGEKPAMLLAWYPTLFSSIEDIYWTRRKLVERLRRSPVLKAAKEEVR